MSSRGADASNSGGEREHTDRRLGTDRRVGTVRRRPPALGVRFVTGAALLTAALQSCVGAGRSASEPPPHDRVCEDPELERRIVELVRAGIDVKEPNGAALVTGGEPTVFDGSYDWHSCVLGHWTLLVSSRVRGDGELRDWVEQRLSIDVLEYESGLLVGGDARRRPTWPYDEAWFCLLLAELDRVDSDRDGAVPGSAISDSADRGSAVTDGAVTDGAVREGAGERFLKLRRRHEQRLFTALVDRPFPDGPLADRTDALAAAIPGEYCGFYRSWLWAFVALAWCEPVDPALADRLAELWSVKVAPELDRIAALEDAHPYDFLWVPALAALGAEAVGSSDAPPFGLLEPPALPDTVVVATVHVLGVHLSRFWPVAASDNPARRAAYLAARDALIAREDLWAEGFDASTHWLPQYLFIGEWLAADRP